MAIDLNKYLKEVSPDAPAGVDMEYDTAFTELFQQARGKAETQWSASEEPNWRELREGCLKLLGQTKDLRLAMLLALALVKTDGLPGFADGLELLSGMLERYWETLYPALDPDDGDPTERINVVASLSPAAGTSFDTYLFRERVREAPVVVSPRVGRFSLRDIDIATGRAPRPAEGTSPDERTIDAAFADAAPEQLQGSYNAAGRAVTATLEIEKGISSHVGEGKKPDLSSVRQLLEEIVAVTRQHLVKRGLIATGAGAADNDAAAAAVAGGEGQSQGGARGGVAGVIATRQDVVTAIDRICEFFERNEPSSPIPLLLLRARRLVSKSFAEVMRDLSPDALGTLSVISGTDLAAEPGSEGQ